MRSHDRPVAPIAVKVIGDDLLSLAVKGVSEAALVARHLRSGSDWLEAVAGINSVVVQFDNASLEIDTAIDMLTKAVSAAPAADHGIAPVLEIPVCYGGDFGPDLDTVCRQLGIAPKDFIRQHVSQDFRVDLLGFTPGFAYIGGLPKSLNVGRRPEPRQHIAAGSVGIADDRTGIYALPGPGGWSIVGRTPLRLFDASLADPFSLSAGMRVRFRAIDTDDYLALGHP